MSKTDNEEKKFRLALVEQKEKTAIYDVYANIDYKDIKVGRIRWGTWYQYAFFPDENVELTFKQLLELAFTVKDFTEERQFVRELAKGHPDEQN